MIFIVCNHIAHYHKYVATTIAQSNAMSTKDFFPITRAEDVNKVISAVANEVRIIEFVDYLDSDSWVDIMRRIR